METAAELNRRGHRTKEYTSRREVHHPARPFGWTQVQYMLSNLGYMGKKEINKTWKTEDQAKLPEDRRYCVVDGIWPAIVDEAKFEAVQRLLKANRRTRTNQVRIPRHVYVLNGGLLYCGECGTMMEGRSGTSRLSKRYYYYRCRKEACRFKLPAVEIERMIVERIAQLSSREDYLADLVAHTNRQLQQDLPAIVDAKADMAKELARVSSAADGLLMKLGELSGPSLDLAKRKLGELAERQEQMKGAMAEADEKARQIQQDAVNHEVLGIALRRFSGAFGDMPPHRRKETLRLILKRAEVSGRKLVLELFGRPPEPRLMDEMLAPKDDGGRFAEIPSWLPD